MRAFIIAMLLLGAVVGTAGVATAEPDGFGRCEINEDPVTVEDGEPIGPGLPGIPSVSYNGVVECYW